MADTTAEQTPARRSVPALVPQRPGRAMRLLRQVNAGVRRTSAQIEPYTAHWDAQNQIAAAGSGPLLVGIGDSTSIGIGASRPENGMVGRLRALLSESDHPATRRKGDWRAINLAVSGARAADALDRQLPILEQLPAVDLVVCCIGTNDVVWTAADNRLRDELRRLAAGLPPGSVVCELAGMSKRARLANRALRNASEEHGLRFVNPWVGGGSNPRSRLSEDRFHPNDHGYALMATAIVDALHAG